MNNLIDDIKKLMDNEKEYIDFCKKKYEKVKYCDKNILLNNQLPTIYLGQHDCLFDYLIYVKYFGHLSIFIEEDDDVSQNHITPYLISTINYNSLFVMSKRYKKIIDTDKYIVDYSPITIYVSNHQFKLFTLEIKIFDYDCLSLCVNNLTKTIFYNKNKQSVYDVVTKYCSFNMAEYEDFALRKLYSLLQKRNNSIYYYMNK
uniref:Uncharacterized protein n=1 Tax=viral metagenome TaxID=1070528 RepID=A0A6C0H6P0_9ZZZZ